MKAQSTQFKKVKAVKVAKARKPKTVKPQGYVLENRDGFAVIATGFRTPPTNRKTGGLIQVYIIVNDQKPWAAVKAGRDSIICGDCKHRGTIDAKGKVKNRSCYVVVAQGPTAVYRAFSQGKYTDATTWNADAIGQLFVGRKVRFGAYGDPAFISLPIIQAIVGACNGHTGYTHQWSKLDQSYAKYLMASVDSFDEYNDAKAEDWRTFRVRNAGETIAKNEFICPASGEFEKARGFKLACDTCLACSGTGKGRDRDVVIIAHGQNDKVRAFAVNSMVADFGLLDLVN